MSNGPASDHANSEWIAETLLLPALSGEGAVLVTGDLTDTMTHHFEAHQLVPPVRRFRMTEILAGASTGFSHTDALVVSDFRKAEKNNRTVVIRLLGYLRDRSVAKILHLVVNTRQTPEWSMADSLALGFTRRGVAHAKHASYNLYEFNIKSYKTEPDWLNGKNWAHPHLWQVNCESSDT